MISSDFRLAARRKLEGKWGKAICTILAYLLISFVIGLVEGLWPEGSFNRSVVELLFAIINVPLAFGFSYAFFKLFYEEEVGAFGFINLGFSNFSKAWAVAWRIFLKVLAPFILMVVGYALILGAGIAIYSSSIASVSSSYHSVAESAAASGGILAIIGLVLVVVSMVWFICKSYYYQLAQMVAFDNPELTAKECVEKSQELMTNRRGKLFCLQFSFIGWAILAAFTFGIGLLWLLPYIQFANIAFYDAFAHGNDVEAEVVEENV